MAALYPGVEKHAERGTTVKAQEFDWVMLERWQPDVLTSSTLEIYMVSIIIFDVLFAGLLASIS